jgi:2-oxoglutarate dehydrogenase E2 component (dihydrolipoamide succinyltransferase)
MERTTTIGSGRVWYVSGNTLIVTLPNNENRSFKVDDSYRFTVAGQPASVHDLKKGMVINAQKIVEQPKSTFASNVAVTGQAPPAPQPRQVAQNRTLAPAPQPAPAPSPAATPAPAPAPEPAPAQAPALPRKLPDTASPFPLAGVAGLLLVAASFGVRAFRH